MRTLEELRKLNNTLYLGDGVYIGDDGFGFWLATADGINVNDAIYLEPSVVKSLRAYLRRIEEQRKAGE